MQGLSVRIAVISPGKQNDCVKINVMSMQLHDWQSKRKEQKLASCECNSAKQESMEDEVIVGTSRHMIGIKYRTSQSSLPKFICIVSVAALLTRQL